MANVFGRLRVWAVKRNIIKGSTIEKQIIKLQEEVGELCEAYSKNHSLDKFHIELGDVVQVCSNLAEMTHSSLEQACEISVNVRDKRNGYIVNGTYLKADDIVRLAAGKRPFLMAGREEDGEVVNLNDTYVPVDVVDTCIREVKFATREVETCEAQ